MVVEDERKINIFIRTLVGRTICLQVRPSDTIDDIKEILYDTEGIPQEQQRLRACSSTKIAHTYCNCTTFLRIGSRKILLHFASKKYCNHSQIFCCRRIFASSNILETSRKETKRMAEINAQQADEAALAPAGATAPTTASSEALAPQPATPATKQSVKWTDALKSDFYQT